MPRRRCRLKASCRCHRSAGLERPRSAEPIAGPASASRRPRASSRGWRYSCGSHECDGPWLKATARTRRGTRRTWRGRGGDGAGTGRRGWTHGRPSVPPCPVILRRPHVKAAALSPAPPDDQHDDAGGQSQNEVQDAVHDLAGRWQSHMNSPFASASPGSSKRSATRVNSNACHVLRSCGHVLTVRENFRQPKTRPREHGGMPPEAMAMRSADEVDPAGG